MPSGQLNEWLHEYVLRPFLEGIERLKRAWEGVNFHSIYRNKLTWKERVISILTGVVLTFFPFINLIIWQWWMTFGKPEILTEPYRSGEETAPLITIPFQPIEIPLPKKTATLETAPAPVQAAAPVAEAAAHRVQKMIFSDKTHDTTHLSNWRVEHFPDMILAYKDGSENRITTRYDSNWNLQEYDYIAPDGGHLHAVLEDRKMSVVGDPIGAPRRTKEHHLTENWPWLQQVTLGLRNFVLSTDQITYFYGMHPKDYSIMHVQAKKVGIQDVPGFGQLMKVEVSLAGWRSYFWKAEIWLHPETGLLHKMLASAGPFAAVTLTELVQNNP